MIVVPARVKLHLAWGHTDMHKGPDGLATLIQEHLNKCPFSGHLFVFRGKNASLQKIGGGSEIGRDQRLGSA
ncbi:transposase [Mesorhizobium sp. L103C119B0]|uniref:IS66 family insertion sequence element accessory protein TnpB n=1 Tax=Mesorhizobium sp. L103C119B0 TaxID=1287085 RepID=UPI0003D03ACE|nr:IS66 family insertion sequence element accessory protein TnpB [Mesorhizobium sp. L103C119B0]ESZ70313.1 transposase [Mesorhizobium sp. L103C119B0]